MVTIEEESFFPWSTAPTLARRLDELAKRHGATIMGTGAQDVYWMTLPSVLMGAAHRVDSVSGRTRWNVDDYGLEVAEHVHAGATLDEFDAHVAAHGWPSFVVRNTVDALVADAGLTPGEVETEVTPVLASEPTPSRALGRVIERGSLLGVTDTATITAQRGTVVQLSADRVRVRLGGDGLTTSGSCGASPRSCGCATTGSRRAWPRVRRSSIGYPT